MASPARRAFATSPALILAIDRIADAVGIDVELGQMPTASGPASPTPSTPAASSSQLHHTHQQNTASTTWDVVHPLRYRPAALTVTDDSGNPWWPTVTWVNDQHAILSFPIAVRGRADLS